MTQKVHIVEVGPRDGFQMETAFIPTALKIEAIDLLASAGIRKIEATSFVSPRVIPQMQDATEVMARIKRVPGVQYSALVPNLKGAERAVMARVDAVRMVVCASETYNQRNVGLSVTESLRNCQSIYELATAHNIGCEAIIALAFGCPLEGDIPEARVIEIAGKLIDMGFQELGIADSIGVANPVTVKRLMQRLHRDVPGPHYSLHFHDTRGLGLVNVMAALEEGIDTFDSSLGGLGGCPVVAGGSGNIPTEDLVNLLDETGNVTGIDLDLVMKATQKVHHFLNRSLPSRILNAGTRKRLFEHAMRAN
jgi:hydroxymethylglutaryl-CoA lyase